MKSYLDLKFEIFKIEMKQNGVSAPFRAGERKLELELELEVEVEVEVELELEIEFELKK